VTARGVTDLVESCYFRRKGSKEPSHCVANGSGTMDQRNNELEEQRIRVTVERREWSVDFTMSGLADLPDS
jgi:hypothetical protein